MKEHERRYVANSISKKIKEKESLEGIRSEISLLESDPKVVRYLELLERIKTIEDYFSHIEEYGDGEDWFQKMITYEFSSARYKKDSEIEFYPCSHDIWVYDGSYYLSKDYIYHEHDHYCKEYSETDVKGANENYSFVYNRYVCLECGKVIETQDWEKFERTHFVLKNQKPTDYSVEYYKNLYLTLLYTSSVEDAKKAVIDEFNKHKENYSKLERKRN